MSRMARQTLFMRRLPILVGCALSAKSKLLWAFSACLANAALMTAMSFAEDNLVKISLKIGQRWLGHWPPLSVAISVPPQERLDEALAPL
jgi:pyocin large subunit-like protein